MNSDKPPSALPEPSPVEFGGRVELRLVSTGDAQGATLYAARWFTADQDLEGEVSISQPANSEAPKAPEVLVSSPEALPEWLSSFTTTLVRTTARNAQKENSWPRRLTRWRKAPAEKK
jgi:hypothetical protein